MSSFLFKWSYKCVLPVIKWYFSWLSGIEWIDTGFKTWKSVLKSSYRLCSSTVDREVYCSQQWNLTWLSRKLTVSEKWHRNSQGTRIIDWQTCVDKSIKLHFIRIFSFIFTDWGRIISLNCIEFHKIVHLSIQSEIHVKILPISKNCIVLSKLFYWIILLSH